MSFTVAEVLYSHQFPEYKIAIVAGKEGQIRGIVSDSLSEKEVLVQGIPRSLNILNPRNVLAAMVALQERYIRYDSLAIQVDPRLKGGGPPLEADLNRMGNSKTYQYDEAGVVEETFIQQAIITGGPIIGLATLTGSPPVIGLAAGLTFLCGFLVNLYKNIKSKAKSNELEKNIQQLQTELSQGGITAKQGHEAFARQLHDVLADPEDRRAVVNALHDGIEAKRREIIDQPVNPNKRMELAALLDIVHMVSAAIPDKSIAHTVAKAGEATLSFAKAFLMVKEMGGIAAVGLSGMLGPAGLVLNGIMILASLMSDSNDQDLIQEVSDQIQRLSQQTAEFEQRTNLRFDKLETLFANFRGEVFEQFKQLNGNMNKLRRFCREQYRETNLKLDRISGYISAGLPAVVSVGMTTLKSSAKGRIQLGTITQQQHDDYIVDFVSWSRDHSRNPVFTGSLNTNYEPENVSAVLKANDPEKLLQFLARVPSCSISMDLPNPYVWADAAESYMQLRLNTPQFDASFGNNHLPLFLDIYRTGQGLMEFIAELQQNRNLFEALMDEYETTLSQMSEGSFDPHLLAHLDATRQLLVAYSQIAFQQSTKQDLIFGSYLGKKGNPRLRLVDGDDVQALMDEVNQAPADPERDYLRKELFCDLQRTATYFREVLTQKVDEAQDSHSLITSTMQRLWDFGSRYFPNEPNFAPGNYPKTHIPHVVDVNRILVNDIFYAIFSGNANAVDSLLKDHAKTDSLGRTPLHYACSSGQLDIVQKLINAGADVNAKDEGRETPISMARRAKNMDIERALLAKGAVPYFNRWIPGEDEYQKGQIVRFQSIPDAIQHFKNAASLGHVGALYEVGNCLFLGNVGTSKGVRQDPETRSRIAEAMKWLIMAADRGHADATFMIGWIHHVGNGMPQNNQEALKWFRKAAALGHPNGQHFVNTLKV